MSNELRSFPNPDLAVAADNKPSWSLPARRRDGFRNLHRINRYGMMIRSDQVLELTPDIDRRIGEREDVVRLTRGRAFCSMLVARGQTVLHETSAGDFAPDRPHSIMSITKMTMNLVIGRLIAQRRIDPEATIDTWLPEIGTGYARATIQQALDMNVVNDYSEDYEDPMSTSYAQEEVIGWRLPPRGSVDRAQAEFLPTIESEDVTNPGGQIIYKSANTDVLACVAERAGGRPLRDWLTEIVEAAGFEGALHMSTDRAGFPIVDGGGCVSIRDLARFGLLFARRGRGVQGRQVGDAAYIEESARRPGTSFAPPRDWIRYSNQCFTNGRWIGHGGYGGQFLLIDLESGVVGAFFSVLENRSAHDEAYMSSVIRMLESVAAES